MASGIDRVERFTVHVERLQACYRPRGKSSECECPRELDPVAGPDPPGYILPRSLCCRPVLNAFAHAYCSSLWLNSALCTAT